MFPLQQSKKFKNIHFAYEVPPEFINNVEIVYEEFREYDDKDILVLRSVDHVFPDKFGILFDSFGILTYDIKHTSLIAAYSMFHTAKETFKKFKPHANIYSHSFGFELAIFKSLGSIPPKYISTFEDIPGFENLGKINPTEKQIKYIQKYVRYVNDNAKRLDGDFSLDAYLDKLITFMPACSIDILFGDHMNLEFTDQFDKYEQEKQYVMTKLISQIPRVYTKSAVVGEPLDDVNFLLIDRRMHCIPIRMMRNGNKILVSCSEEIINPKYQKLYNL